MLYLVILFHLQIISCRLSLHFEQEKEKENTLVILFHPQMKSCEGVTSFEQEKEKENTIFSVLICYNSLSGMIDRCKLFYK